MKYGLLGEIQKINEIVEMTGCSPQEATETRKALSQIEADVQTFAHLAGCTETEAWRHWNLITDPQYVPCENLETRH